MCKCQEENTNLFIQSVFNDCIENKPVFITGFIFGWLSIFCWLVCFIPQLR